MLNSTLEKGNCLRVFSALLIVHLFIFNPVIAKEFQTQSTNKNFSPLRSESFDIRAWQSKFGSDNEKQRFNKSDSINIKATVTFRSSSVGKSSTIYILAKIGDQAFMKDSSGLWHLFTGELIAFDHRIVKETEEVEIISNLSNVLIEADIYVGFFARTEDFDGNLVGDIIFNKEAFHVRIDNAYNKALTVGENGSFQGCNGLQFALNIVQDWEEIRIEQGSYQCTGLELPEAKEFTSGIRISGGWNSTFTHQSSDPSLTVFDGGALVNEDESIVDKESCEVLSGIWYAVFCLQALPDDESKSILKLNSDLVAIDTLTFKNTWSKDGSAIEVDLFLDEPTSIENCIFEHNNGHFGGAVNNISFIINSIFKQNVSSLSRFNSSGGGGAISSVKSVSGSQFIQNFSQGEGGAINGVGKINNSLFINNISDQNGGAVAGAHSISHSIFTANTARHKGGALYAVSGVSFSEFYGNTTTSDGGGAISSGHPLFTVVNSGFTANKSESEGGAIEVLSDALIMNNLFVNNHSKKGGAISKTQKTSSSNNIYINNTFVKNTAIESGGAFYGIGNIYNSIFSENTADGESNDVHSTGDDIDGFIIDYSLFSIVTGTVDIRPGFILGDPLFVDSEKSDYRLQINSPAIDAGGNGFLNDIGFLKDDDYSLLLKNLDVDNLIDLDNAPRIQGEGIDMGAYEFQ